MFPHGAPSSALCPRRPHHDDLACPHTHALGLALENALGFARAHTHARTHTARALSLSVSPHPRAPLPIAPFFYICASQPRLSPHFKPSPPPALSS